MSMPEFEMYKSQLPVFLTVAIPTTHTVPMEFVNTFVVTSVSSDAASLFSAVVPSLPSHDPVPTVMSEDAQPVAASIASSSTAVTVFFIIIKPLPFSVFSVPRRVSQLYNKLKHSESLYLYYIILRIECQGF